MYFAKRGSLTKVAGQLENPSSTRQMKKTKVALPRLLLDAARLSCFGNTNVIDERNIRSISK